MLKLDGLTGCVDVRNRKMIKAVTSMCPQLNSVAFLEDPNVGYNTVTPQELGSILMECQLTKVQN